MLVECKHPGLLSESANMGDLVKYTIGVLEKYNDCALRHNALVKWEKEHVYN